MKRLSVLLAALVLGVFFMGQPAVHADQAPDQSAAIPAFAEGAMLRMAALLHLHPAPYSTPETAPLLVNCQPVGAACGQNSDCCSRKCCTDDFEECEGIGGTCDSYN